MCHTNKYHLQGNVVLATELARRYGDKGIVSTSLNPGTKQLCGHPETLCSWLVPVVYAFVLQVTSGQTLAAHATIGKCLLSYVTIQ